MSQSQTEHTVSASLLDAGRRRLMIALYGMAVFLYWMSLYLYVPTLPTYVQSKSDNLALVGIVIAQYGLWQGIVRLPLGIAADWLGWRRPFIIVGFALVGLGALTMGAADSVNGLIVGRAITGLASGRCWSQCSAACFHPTRRSERLPCSRWLARSGACWLRGSQAR